MRSTTADQSRQPETTIPQEQQLLAALERRSAQLEHLLTISPVVIYTCAPDAPTTLTFVSANVESLLGYPAAAFVQHSHALTERLHPDDLDTVNTAPQTLFGRGANAIEYRLRHADGTYRWLSDRQRLVYDAQQRPLEIVGCWIDITEHKVTEEAMQRLNRKLVLLSRASRVLAATLNLDQVLTTVMEEMQRILGVSACSVWLTDPNNGDLICRHASGPHSGPVRGLRVASGSGLVGWVVETGRHAIVDDVTDDPRHCREIAHLTQLTARSALCVPLRSKEGPIGVLEVVDTAPGRFTEDDLELLEPLAALAANAIENARLYEQARQDMTTKSILLDEINHRVKNNLASIMGILTLEMQRAFEGPQDYHGVLRDIQSRIQSITTVHSLLSEVQWAPLPLTRLAAEIIHVALSASPIRQYIKVQVRPEETTPGAESLLISPRQATALAIIINELTTNSIKHAFAARQQGHIALHIRSEETVGTPRITLEYRDDGPGWPQDVLAGARSNIGLRLIRMTTISPLRGQLNLYNEQGAVAAITFNLLPFGADFGLHGQERP